MFSAYGKLTFSKFLAETAKIRETSYIDLLMLLRRVSFQRRESPLDWLLPKNSCFSKLPHFMRSAVVCMEPFVIAGSNLDEDYAKGYDVRIDNVVIGLPADYYTGSWTPKKGPVGEMYPLLPDAVRVFLGLSSSSPDFGVIRNAKFIYDLDDDFVRILLADCSKIIPGSPIERMVKDYFLQLAVFFISGGRLLLDFLNVKEEEICAHLKRPRPTLIQARLGYVGMGLLRRATAAFVYTTRERAFVAIDLIRNKS
jgi:hypothetical protein